MTLIVGAGLLLLVAALGLVAHNRTPGRATALGVSAFSPYLMLAAVPALIVLVLARQWFGVAVAAIVLVLCVSTQGRLYLAETGPADARPLVTLTANLHLGDANAAELVAAVRTHRVDLLATQEMTPESEQRILDAGILTELPYQATDSKPGAAGTGLWSRYPLSAIDRRKDFSFAAVTASLELPGVPRPVTVGAFHMNGPVPHSAAWQDDIRHLPSVLRELGHGGPVVAAGDLNATPDIVQFRDLLVDGYADAAQQAGAGMTLTYPADRWYPPLIAIDHVLTRDAVATTADTIHISDTDHRALLVTVQVPRTA
ncbi:MAG TPA: endonuclease/exonuclease/phosphatase family protein [Jatrophihabitans sp.]|uniref:endonuclease/exonuclease/phosphatase family protein n=1 Tax=Jatrophihabitans sp. TaxID=1932789 RepID=UPI002E0CE6C8|nr:endonuclease/exonuclease/phosphatase family protein [Jatrophihabitans sp.]